VPAHFQKFHVGRGRLVVFQQFAQPIGERGVREETSARRGRVVGDAELGGQSHLRFAGAAREAEQRLAVDEALALGEGGRQALRRKRPKQAVVEPCFTLHKRQGLAVLRHRPLAEHFPGKDKIGSFLFHQASGLAKGPDAAIDAGVHPLAEAVVRMADDFQVGFGRVNRLDSHAARLDVAHRTRLRLGVGRERTPEVQNVQRNHLDILLLHQADGERRIEPPRDASDGFRHVRPPCFPRVRCIVCRGRKRIK